MSQVPDDAVRRRHRELWIETIVVLLVCAVPYLFSSMASLYLADYPRHVTFLEHALSSLSHSIESIAVVLFVIWRSRDPFSRFGLQRIRIVPTLLGGVGIWAVAWVVARLVWIALPMVIGRENFLEIARQRFHYTVDDPSGPFEYLILALIALSNGLAEELAMRAYLITRFEELLDNKPIAFLLSTVIFISYHGYQGTWGVIGVAILGVVYASAFCVFRRLAPVALAHALQDFIAVGGFLRHF
jgi:membrane protease YdiL (CAAX protease family)